MESNLTTIQVTPIDAKMFLSFQKHYALVKLMDSVGGFDIKNGSIKINFDTQGKIKEVVKIENYIPLLTHTMDSV